MLRQARRSVEVEGVKNGFMTVQLAQGTSSECRDGWKKETISTSDPLVPNQIPKPIEIY